MTEETIAPLRIGFSDSELEIWRMIAVMLARTHPDEKRYGCLPTIDTVR